MTSMGVGEVDATNESSRDQDVRPARSISTSCHDGQSKTSQEDIERRAGPSDQEAKTTTAASQPEGPSRYSLGGLVSRFREHLSSSSLSTRYHNTSHSHAEDGEPSETSALLPERPLSSKAGSIREEASLPDTKSIDPQVRKTTWQEESKILFSSTAQLIGTAFLEYAIINSNVISVGHLGKVELGAASLATVTATITGFILFQGLVTGLDTMSPQAFGAGHKELVGLQAQRMTYFLWLLIIPIGAIWLSAGPLFRILLPQPEVAELAGTYLRIALLGLPGFALFQVLEIYLQAQGIFSASFMVLLVCAPLHVFMNWLFVWVCLDKKFLDSVLAAGFPCSFPTETQLGLRWCTRGVRHHRHLDATTSGAVHHLHRWSSMLGWFQLQGLAQLESHDSHCATGSSHGRGRGGCV